MAAAAEGQAPPPTSAVLMSLSKHIAVRCSKVNKAYMACKQNDANPEACLPQGDAVTSCVIDL
jgi:NADH dehydrogenase (ubiquinone) 1 alpha subcomplex subunit 8